MSDVPTLTVAQWRRIMLHLPPTRRDRLTISAILFRETDGASVRDTCELYGVTRTRLSEWTRALEADGSLARIMRTLRLERANPLRWRVGGVSFWKRSNSRTSVMQERLREFDDVLHRSR
jgi:hypothetical protein